MVYNKPDGSEHRELLGKYSERETAFMQETKQNWSMRDHDMFLSGYEKVYDEGYKEGKDEIYRYLACRHKEMGKSSEEIADILNLSVHEVEKYEKEIEQEIRSWQPVN